jgi:hypothetical protein
MRTHTVGAHWAIRSLSIIGSLAALSACTSESSTAPSLSDLRPLAAAAVGHGDPDLGNCADLVAPAGSTLAARTFASGVQIYRWSGSDWAFVAPEATLYADATEHGVVGTHYAGPKWESNSSGIVAGTVAKRCPVAGTIPWLSLNATAEGAGIFHRVTFIQRVNTTGGTAPTTAGQFVGEIARVAYTAEYFFYR